MTATAIPDEVLRSYPVRCVGRWCVVFFLGDVNVGNDGKMMGKWWNMMETYVGNDGKMMEHDGHEYGRIMENKPEKYEKMMGEIVEMSSSFSHKHLDFFQQLLRKTVQQRLRFYPMDYRIGKFAATWATCTWWLIPVSKWITTPVISELTLLRPVITRGITYLLSGGEPPSSDLTVGLEIGEHLAPWKPWKPLK